EHNWHAGVTASTCTPCPLPRQDRSLPLLKLTFRPSSLCPASPNVDTTITALKRGQEARLRLQEVIATTTVLRHYSKDSDGRALPALTSTGTGNIGLRSGSSDPATAQQPTTASTSRGQRCPAYTRENVWKEDERAQLRRQERQRRSRTPEGADTNNSADQGQEWPGFLSGCGERADVQRDGASAHRVPPDVPASLR
ncbi:unnamed protein product, partial [Ectocarpus sp. 12 AP-2014]